MNIYSYKVIYKIEVYLKPRKEDVCWNMNPVHIEYFKTNTETKAYIDYINDLGKSYYYHCQKITNLDYIELLDEMELYQND